MLIINGMKFCVIARKRERNKNTCLSSLVFSMFLTLVLIIHFHLFLDINGFKNVFMKISFQHDKTEERVRRHLLIRGLIAGLLASGVRSDSRWRRKSF